MWEALVSVSFFLKNICIEREKEREEALFTGEDCADFFEGEEAADFSWLGGFGVRGFGEAAQPAAVDGCADGMLD